MKLEGIRKELSKSKKTVFSINDIIRYGKIGPASAKIYANRMVKKGLLTRISRNKYTISEDPFVIASQLFNNSYISFTSALYLYEIIDQVPSKIQLVSPLRSKIKLEWLKLIKFSPNKIFGIKRMKKEGSFIFVGRLEKVVVDIAYRPRYSRLLYAFHAIEKCDIKKIVKYAKKMNIATKKRIGYFLDLKGIHTHLDKGLTGVHKLNPQSKKRGTFNKKWKLYINEKIR